jgi:membrane-bound ClpP family serine protease
MRKSTVRLGINCLIAGIISVILVSYFHQTIAGFFLMSTATEAEFVFLGLFGGGILGALGVIVSALGFFRSPSPEPSTHLAPSLIILIAVIILFFTLFISFFKSFEPQQIQPGETITI